MGIDVESVFRRIDDVIIKACIAVEPNIYTGLKRATKHPNLCFELYGFDILLDENLKPWLLEVNVSPSLSNSSPMDRQIKTTLMCDVFNLVGLRPYDRKKYQREEENKKNIRFLGLFSHKAHPPKASPADHPERRKGKSVHELMALDKFTELCEEDLEVIIDSEEELSRRGQFRHIFPTTNNITQYWPYFETVRYKNLLLWKWLKSKSNSGLLSQPECLQKIISLIYKIKL